MQEAKPGTATGTAAGSATEQQLITRATRGDLDAFNQLVLAYQNLAYSVAYRTMQEEDAAADAVQESMIKAFRSLGSFQGGSFKSWIIRIVVNTCYDALRSRKRRRTDSLGDFGVGASEASGEVGGEASAHRRSPIGECDSKQNGRDVSRASSRFQGLRIGGVDMTGSQQVRKGAQASGVDVRVSRWYPI